ncbi:unnamed protein product [Lactuca saligna]|uniref:Uncharacterized protein n=1 Tax=Lactuca saligna TaxID=75948 RepID=A0AA35YRL1_LACSI|nr:unnamed protein product [Lactuca saligna]
MATLSSFKTTRLSWKLFFLVLFFTILLVGPSSATSRGKTIMQPEHHRKKYDVGSKNPSLLFNVGSSEGVVPREDVVPSEDVGSTWKSCTIKEKLGHLLGDVAPPLFFGWANIIHVAPSWLHAEP